MVEVTQTDREAAANVWRDYVAKIGEVMAEKAIRNGGNDDTNIVQAFATHRHTSTAASEARIAELEGALKEAEEVFSLVERPAITDPDYHAVIAQLGERIGFGALMSGASAEWRKRGDIEGAEFVAGPCHATVVSTLAMIRQALKGPTDAK